MGALSDSESIRLSIDYFRQFFDTELLDLIVKQSNLYCTQHIPNHALKLDQKVDQKELIYQRMLCTAGG